MNLKEFDYHLPEKFIAQYPLRRRDEAKLLVIDRKRRTLRHDVFKNIESYLPPKSLMVLNNSEVVPARLLGQRQKSGGHVEIFLLKKLKDGYSYEVLMRPLRRLKVDERISFNGGSVIAQVKDKKNPTVRFNRKNISRFLNDHGHVPLPPYIKRNDEVCDRQYYQTVFASEPGSVAAPTAGLHFTKQLLKNLKKKGHAVEKVTLHVNYGTFQPVEEQDITKHKMYYEDYSVTKKTQERLKSAKNNGQKIVAVGTTSCRVLETMSHRNQRQGSTNIFIYPGYSFRMVDVLVTNFHLPFSTLLMLVYAFAGKKLMQKAYKEATKKKYRFYSYGDAMVIL